MRSTLILLLRTSCLIISLLQSGHSAELTGRVSVGKKKPSRRIPLFLVHVEILMDEIWDEICYLAEEIPYAQEALNATCYKIDELVVQEGKRFYEMLPEYLYADYKALAIANAVSMELKATGENPVIPEAPKYFWIMSRVHRALGYGNALLMLGYPPRVVERTYRTYYNQILWQEDNNVPPPKSGRLEYCTYINSEYEHLKDYARTLTSTLTTPTINLDYTMLYLCMHQDLGYLVQTDWAESHRLLTGALMSTCGRPIALFLVLYWESLFNADQSTEDAYALYTESFDVIVDYIAWNNNTFICV